jgi:hypothetical protein
MARFLFLVIAVFLYPADGQNTNPSTLPPSGTDHISKTLSVCDVLANPKKYEGELVTIRAALVSSFNDTDFDELAPLPSERCYRARRRDSLRIGIGAGLPNPPESLHVDLGSYDKAGKMLNDILQKEPETKSVLVTVEGIIYDGGPEPLGITRHPWYPARMLISSWKEIRKP